MNLHSTLGVLLGLFIGLAYADIEPAAESLAPSSSSSCFPDDFLFGTATAAYQVEGAWNESGREMSIWDVFCRADPDRDCANVADDFFHRYKQDIQMMKKMGLNSFRFSISWSRVMNWDANTKEMKANEAGIAFYHSLIQELKSNEIEPVLTMYHWDLPEKLQTEISPPGWLNKEIVSHFITYSTLLYKEFGRDVKYWSTFNEPHSFTTAGYGSGAHAPGFTNSSTYEYTVAHNVLLSHAKAVETFRLMKDQGKIDTGAKISIVLNCDYAYPLDPSSAKDQAAAERKLEFQLGWFLQPIVNGTYPQVMKEYVGQNLPVFTEQESQLLKGSYDIFMLNHYSSKVVTDCDSPASNVPCSNLSLGTERDSALDTSRFPQGARLADVTNGKRNCAWFSGYPDGYLQTIRWMHWHDPYTKILLTENGWCGNATVENLNQLWYYETYMAKVKEAMNEGIDIIGYTAWSLLDNYEWGSFDPKFGLFFVDFPKQTGSKEGYTPTSDELERIPRPAALWYGNVSTTKCFPSAAVNKTTSGPPKPEEPHTNRWMYLSISIAAVIVVIIALIVFVKVIRRRRMNAQSNEQTHLLSGSN